MAAANRATSALLGNNALLLGNQVLFHKAKSPALFHPIESVDKFISIEDRNEAVHCTRSISWARSDVFSEYAPGIFDGLQYGILIRSVHGAHLLGAESI